VQDSYLVDLQQCCRKHDEVLKLEEYVLTRFERALPLNQVRNAQAGIGTSSQHALDSVAEQFVDPSFPRLRKIA
jgi:hypothetical protein